MAQNTTKASQGETHAGDNGGTTPKRWYQPPSVASRWQARTLSNGVTKTNTAHADSQHNHHQQQLHPPSAPALQVVAAAAIAAAAAVDEPTEAGLGPQHV